MTKKDYEAFAFMFKNAPEFAPKLRCANVKTPREVFARNCADIFAADNPRFDKARFLKACGIEG